MNELKLLDILRSCLDVQLTCYSEHFNLDLYAYRYGYTRFGGTSLLDVLLQASNYVIKRGDPIAEQLETYLSNCEESR